MSLNCREEGSGASVSSKHRFSCVLLNRLYHLQKVWNLLTLSQTLQPERLQPVFEFYLFFNSMVSIETVCCNRHSRAAFTDEVKSGLCVRHIYEQVILTIK